MFRSYLRSAYRNIKKRKIITLINVAGLSIIFVYVFLISFYCFSEYGYENQNSNAERTFRIVRGENVFYRSEILKGDSSSALGVEMCDRHSSVFKSYSRLCDYRGLGLKVKQNDNVFKEKHFFFSDPEILNILDVKLIKGSLDEILSAQGSMLISESTVRAYFGNEDVIDKSLIVNELLKLKTVGIFDDIPRESHLHPDFFSIIFDPAKCFLEPLSAGARIHFLLSAFCRNINGSIDNHYHPAILDNHRKSPVKTLHYG